MNVLRHLLPSGHSNSSPRRASGRRTRFHMEQLEDRVLLTNFVVTNTNDAGAGSLREAIDNANLNAGPDGVFFSQALIGQTIQLASSLPTITDEITIRGPVESKDGITIDGQNNSGVRVFRVENTASRAIFRNLTITGGNITQDGAGLLNYGPDTRLINVRVTGNSSGDDGGGIASFNFGTALTLIRSEVSNNTATDGGGGVVMSQSSLNVMDSQIVGNSANNKAGGLWNFAGVATIVRSTISQNIASDDGGGILNENSGTTEIHQSLISGNSAVSGGGVYNQTATGTVLITNSTIAFNSARSDGAASDLGGGGIGIPNGNITIINSTIARNTDVGNGPEGAGGIAKSSGTLTLYNSVVSLNLGGAGTAADDVDFSDVDASSAIFVGGDPRLGALQDNGGPTLTMMPFSNSPLIDSGNNVRATVDGQSGSDPLPGDQRTFSRLIDGNVNGLSTVDVGAVEFNPGPDVPYVTGADAGQPSRITLYNQDGTVRWTKFAFDPAFTGGVRVAVGDVNGDGIQDVIAGEGPGGFSRIRAFNGVNGQFLFGAAPFGSSYSGGIYVAAGDFNDDGLDDVVAGTGGDFVSRVRVRNAANPSQNLRNILVGTASDMDEVQVAVGDVDNDNTLDIIATLGPQVKVFDGSVNTLTPPTLHEVSPFGLNFPGSISVASGDVNGDGFDDIIVGRSVGGDTRVKLYLGSTGAPGGVPWLLQQITYSGPSSITGVSVAARDIDGDGLAEVVTANGPGSDPLVRTFWGDTGYSAFTVFTDSFLNNTLGMFVAIG